MNDYNFKPFDKVLVREDNKSEWCCDFYSHYIKDTEYYACTSGYYQYCIPYEGNEHLLGTTDSPQPKRWRAEKGEYYYYINSFLRVDKCRDDYDCDDDNSYNIGIYFRTEEEAQEMADKFKAMLKGE